MRKVAVAVAASGLAMGIIIASVVNATCAGDCDSDGVVAINELVTALPLALDAGALDSCRPADVDGNGGISIAELIRCVGNALSGCSPSPVPTSTPLQSPDQTTLRSPTPTPSATAASVITAIPTPIPTTFRIDGCVEHFSGCGGSLEFGTVLLSPLGRVADVDQGYFSFTDVPPGDYTLTYSPACNPSGCTGPVQVRITDSDGYAALFRS